MQNNEFRFLVRKLTIYGGGELETHSLCYVMIRCEESFFKQEELIRKASTQQLYVKAIQVRKFSREESGAEYLSSLSLERVGENLVITRIER